jgi:hypothetical protein
MEKFDNSTAHSTSENLTSSTDTLRKEKHNRLFLGGCKWIGAGIVIMAISFGVNFVLFHADVSFTTIMYILTSLGAVCIMKGLYNILG